MEFESRNFITREEFETHLKYLREEIRLREQIAEQERSFERKLEENFEDLKTKANEIRKDFAEMREGIREIKRDCNSMSRKLDRINIFLSGHFFILGLCMIMLACLLKKIGG